MSSPYEQLDAAMAKRRLDVGLKTWRDLAVAADISYETLRALRRGEGTPAEATIHGLERALRWQAGSIDAILSGGEPTPLDGSQVAARRPELDSARDDHRALSPAERESLRVMQMRIEAQERELAELHRRIQELERRPTH